MREVNRRCKGNESKVKDKERITIGSYYNKDVDDIRKYLESNNINVIVLGDGDKIIEQYPRTNTVIYEDDLVVLKSNEINNAMPDLIGLSYKEASNILKLMNVEYTTYGNGYVYEQSIVPGDIINTSVIVKFKTKY